VTRLSNEAKTYIVQSLACFETPSMVQKAVKGEFGVDVTRQAIEAYDPSKRAGESLAGRWRTLFEATRKEFVDETVKVAVSHRAVRLRKIERIVERAESQGNHAMVLQALEQAAKEVGNFYTNRRELSGAGGGPLNGVVRIERVIVDPANQPGQTVFVLPDNGRGDAEMLREPQVRARFG